MEVAAVLFSELYGSYFNVVAAVLAEAVRHSLSGRKRSRRVCLPSRPRCGRTGRC